MNLFYFLLGSLTLMVSALIAAYGREDWVSWSVLIVGIWIINVGMGIISELRSIKHILKMQHMTSELHMLDVYEKLAASREEKA